MNAAEIRKRLERNQRYVAAPGAPYSDVEAQVIGAELDRLEDNGVPVTPDNVVLLATPDDHPMHNLFTWDNEQAADNWRKSEARGIISHLLIITEPEEGDPVVMKARLSVTTKSVEHHAAAPEYVSVCRVLNSPPLRAQLVDQARQELKSWARKYEALGVTELSPVYVAVDNWVK